MNKNFKLDEIKCIFFCLIYSVVNLRNYCPTQYRKDLLPCFCLKYYNFFLTFSSVGFFSEFCIWCEVGYPNSFFCMWIFTCPWNTILKRLFTCRGFSMLVKYRLTTNVYIYFWTRYFVNLNVYLYAIITVLITVTLW